MAAQLSVHKAFSDDVDSISGLSLDFTVAEDTM